MNSNIILKPSINGATRKQTAGLLCDQISELINPIRMNKTIPSQTPNLTKRNITRRVVKEEKKQKIADKAKAVTDKAKAVANEAILKQTKEQIEAANKDIKELKSQQLLARIAELSQEITVLKANAAAAAPVPRNAIRDLTQKQEELEKLKKQLEKELDKKGGKTGGKISTIISANSRAISRNNSVKSECGSSSTSSTKCNKRPYSKTRRTGKTEKTTGKRIR
jgi:chromosome segregation ATPase